MLLEVGIDLVEIGRLEDVIARWGDRFLKRVFTELELDLSRGRVQSLAARFAAKEAFMKALGTGLSGFDWKDVEILANPIGAPQIILYRKAAEIAEQRGLSIFNVSLTHTATVAGAVVVATSKMDVG